MTQQEADEVRRLYAERGTFRWMASALGLDMDEIRAALGMPPVRSAQNGPQPHVCAMCGAGFTGGRGARFCPQCLAEKENARRRRRAQERAAAREAVLRSAPAVAASLMEQKRPKPIKCTGCRYWRCLGESGVGMRACHYLLDTGDLRGIPQTECYRHAGTPFERAQQDGKKERR